ncbi:anti-sigma B factor RsbW [Halalkalibacter akibai]|uniref:Serine-protein kinase RsbW n=1 Tax=Halalkalibacter akibai (strain ATCC 43226 / DSM 21942 / CIP 109018 / JCM 9157 / 1139) TaxID=1236973 RepID=W4R022_HALA3|nr:anti-sigma B factor RsbW [Halalkalibacter akibai]GAE36904.1 serine-protein kinase rsbW [Halalkalibacter akibai JCM 9157]
MNRHEADHIQMTVPAKPEYVGVVRLTVSGIANRIGFSYDDIEDMKIAIAEACTNVVNHAYEEGGIMNISYYLYEERLEIVVADRGQSFDVGSVRDHLGPIDADQPVTDLKEGGLGLFLINTLMDKVEIINESGIVLVMTKFLHGDEVEPHVARVTEAQPEQ